MDISLLEAVIGRNQVWVFCSRLPLPLSAFAIHCWFVIADRSNRLSRWEIWHTPIQCRHSWGYLHRNLFPVHWGIGIFPGCSLWRWSPRLLHYFDSPATDALVKAIESTPTQYPYRYLYNAFPGPNSNSYIQWVLMRFSGDAMNLPLSAIGRNWF